MAYNSLKAYFRRDEAGTETAVSVRRRTVGDHRHGVLVVRAEDEPLVYEKNEDVGRALVDLLYDLGPQRLETDRPAFLLTFARRGTRHRRRRTRGSRNVPRFVTSEHGRSSSTIGMALTTAARKTISKREALREVPCSTAAEIGRSGDRDFADRPTKGNTEYEYFRPIYVQESCLGCHAPPLGGSGIAAAGLGSRSRMAAPPSPICRAGRPVTSWQSPK